MQVSRKPGSIFGGKAKFVGNSQKACADHTYTFWNLIDCHFFYHIYISLRAPARIPINSLKAALFRTRYASFIWHKLPANCDAHLTESIFKHALDDIDV